MLGTLFSRDRLIPPRRWLIIAAIVTVFFLLFSATSRYRTLPFPHFSPSSPSHPISNQAFTKPKDVSIVAFIFFGRRSRVEILRCYIERNLVDNGGWLDEVHWVRNTEKEDDLEYLQTILDSSPRYKMVDLSQEGVGFDGYNHAWNHMERGKLYVKIDDDMVWMADDTIPRLVTTKLEHPEYFLVSANVINSPLMGWVHYHMGALHPYFPEYEGVMNPPQPASGAVNVTSARKSWRYTDYAQWEGPEDWSFGLDQEPPYYGHQWLRLKNNTDLHRTPITEIEYATWGTGLKSWAIVAQEHYSFLENLLDDQLEVYKFRRVWLTDYERLSVNLIALWADEVLDNLPMDSVDEEWLTTTLPKRLGKSVAIESEGLGAHFSFSFQDSGVSLTDLLLRYKDYAEEKICRH